jgi:hypothetical protein
MALTPSGTISLGNINTALGRSSTATISMNDGDVRFLANQDSGSVTMNNMRNKYWFNGTITSASFLGDDFTQNYGKDQFNGSQSGEFNGYSNINLFATDVVFGTTTMSMQSVAYADIGSGRVQVGAGPIATTSFNGFSYSAASGTVIRPSDVGVTRTWRWATP